MTRAFRFPLIVSLWLALALPAAAQSPQIAAESYILLDAESGAVLAEENADLRLPPASLTKIMSAYVYFQAVKEGVLSLSQQVTISENAWGSNVAGSKMFIEVGTQVSVEDLLRGVIIQSGNDASIALAEAVAGDEALFATEMNHTAERLGMKNSNFQNATGLPGKEHYSSARDIAIVSWRTTQDFPDLYKIYAEREFIYNDIRQENRNGLLSSFSGADGIKTGYTRAAGYCLAASAERGGRRLIAVVMKTKSPRVRERETTKLLTYGFNNFRNERFFRADDERTLPVWGGEAKEVRVHPARSGVYTLRRGEEATLEYEPRQPLTAPIGKGDVVGELKVMLDGELHDSVEVLAADAVPEGDWWKRWSDEIKVKWLGHGGNNAVFSQW